MLVPYFISVLHNFFYSNIIMFLLQINTRIVFVTCWKVWVIECCAKSPDFVSIAICRSNFSRLTCVIWSLEWLRSRETPQSLLWYIVLALVLFIFLVFVAYSNGYEVGRLRTAIPAFKDVVFLGRLRGAGSGSFIFNKKLLI